MLLREVVPEERGADAVVNGEVRRVEDLPGEGDRPAVNHRITGAFELGATLAMALFVTDPKAFEAVIVKMVVDTVVWICVPVTAPTP